LRRLTLASIAGLLLALALSLGFGAPAAVSRETLTADGDDRQSHVEGPFG